MPWHHDGLDKLGRQHEIPLKARAGVHLGEVILRENAPEEVARGAKRLEVEGLAKPIAARLMALAGAGQTLLSRTAFDLARRAAEGDPELSSQLQWLAHGKYMLKGVEEPMDVYEVGVEGSAPLVAPTPSEKSRRITQEGTLLGWRPAPGLDVPHRPHWFFVRKLGGGGFGEVWLIAHHKTRDRRVVKLCFEMHQVHALQREVTLFRVLRESLGNRPDIARLLDWNFDEPPYFLEFDFSEGGSLIDWADEQGSLSAVPLPTRLLLMAQVAEAVAAAHSVGVLHKDLKPANVLVNRGPDGTPRAQVTDFGIGRLVERKRLDDLGITALGLTEPETPASPGSASGTRIYMAPELLEGQAASTLADIYALGVMTYQMVVADFRRSLAPGWERDVPDELLRRDIAEFVEGRPQRRVASAHEVARRLRTVEERRRRLQADREEEAQVQRAQELLAQGRRRLRLGALIGALVLGVSLVVAHQARRTAAEAARANREAAAARQVTDFLVSLFEVSDPSESRGNSVTAREILDRGADRIERELSDQPLVRAQLMDAMGTVYLQLGLLAPSAHLLEGALEIRRTAAGPRTLARKRGQRQKTTESNNE